MSHETLKSHETGTDSRLWSIDSISVGVFAQIEPLDTKAKFGTLIGLHLMQYSRLSARLNLKNSRPNSKTGSTPSSFLVCDMTRYTYVFLIIAAKGNWFTQGYFMITSGKT